MSRDISLHPLFDDANSVVSDAASLQALAHPLRLRLLAILRRFGPSTATRLAERCGTSSASTSYHLRILANAGFISDADADAIPGGVTHARDRWWNAVHDSTLAWSPERSEDVVAANSEYSTAIAAMYAERVRAWLAVQHSWPQEWREASTFSDASLFLSPPEAEVLKHRIASVIATFRRHQRGLVAAEGDVPPGAMIVSAQYSVFADPDQDIPRRLGTNSE